ncbi:nuclear transport factor 2 family protein [candidate division KSB1 bacterium]|nr:nuclear transport factor 2 family protein [candidate division KSB1 bacterium]
MSETEIADQLFSCMNSRSLDKLADIVNDDTEFHFPGTAPLHGLTRIQKFLRILFRQYPTLTFTVLDIIHQTGVFVVVWTNTGVHKSGQSYENSGVTVAYVENGIIRFMSDYFKLRRVLCNCVGKRGRQGDREMLFLPFPLSPLLLSSVRYKIDKKPINRFTHR